MNDEERAIWDRLEAAYPIEDVVATPIGAHLGSDVRITIARDGREPVGLIALVPDRMPWFSRRLISAGDNHWPCRYPVGDARALLEQLVDDGGWDELVLGPMLADSDICHTLEGVGSHLGMRPLVTPTSRAPRIVLHGTWADYYANRSARLRADVAHGSRRLAKQGAVSLEEVRDGSKLDAALDAFFAVEATGWKLEQRTAIACDPALRARYVALAHAAAERGLFRTFQLRAGDAVVAANFCLVHGRDLFQLKTGYDAAHAKASPGQVLHARVLEALWTAGEVNSFDFMPGGGEHGAYKERWANDVRAYAEVRLFRPRRARGQLLAGLVRIKRALDARREHSA